MTYRSAFASHILALTLALLALTAPPASAGISSCTGDCNGDLIVTIDELVRGVTIALGDAPLANCPDFDRNGDGQVSIDELLAGVGAAIDACPTGPTATATPTTPGAPTATATSTGQATATSTSTGQATATATATGQATATATSAATTTGTPAATATTTATGEPTDTPSPTETEPPTPTPTTTPSGNVSDLIAVIDGGEVRLAWTNPDPAGGFTQALLLRRLNAEVAGPEDPAARLVSFGSNSMAVHPLSDLLPSVDEQARVYHYAVFPCTASGECADQSATATLSPTLVEALRGGGYVLHFRHAAATVCEDHTEFGTAENPAEPNWWKSCVAECDEARAQQLNEQGVASATAVGQAFDILRIPVARVVSSEFCRAVTTAQLFDFGPTIEQSPALTYFVYDEAERCASSYDLINQVPAAGSNTVLVGHTGFSPPCPVLSTLGFGEAAVFKPDGQGGDVFVTRVGADEWSDLLPSGPSGLSANVDQTHVRLTWLNGPGYPRVRLLRRLNAVVDGPDDPDAQLVYAGPADTVLDPLGGLLPTTPTVSRFYHYSVYGCVNSSSCEQIGSQTIIAPTIVQTLRAGGYVIFWRHATALTCQDRTDLGTAATTTVPDWWKSCDATCTGENVTATARQLSDIGRSEAMTIGESFDTRGIPISRVLSSEFCRAIQTAQLMDFGPPIETTPDLTYFVYDEANRCAKTFQLLDQNPPPGGNAALISHAGNTCPPLSNLSMSGAAIYKPNGSDAPIFIDAVNFQEWETLP